MARTVVAHEEGVEGAGVAAASGREARAAPHLRLGMVGLRAAMLKVPGSKVVFHFAYALDARVACGRRSCRRCCFRRKLNEGWRGRGLKLHMIPFCARRKQQRRRRGGTDRALSIVPAWALAGSVLHRKIGRPVWLLGRPLDSRQELVIYRVGVGEIEIGIWRAQVEESVKVTGP